jgi:hypothetical protein
MQDAFTNAEDKHKVQWLPECAAALYQAPMDADGNAVVLHMITAHGAQKVIHRCGARHACAAIT